MLHFPKGLQLIEFKRVVIISRTYEEYLAE